MIFLKSAFCIRPKRGKKVTMDLTYILSAVLKLNHVHSSEEATELTTFDRLPHVDSGELTYTC
jgi:hypothetical protein